ncbi:uncharacterized protein LOC117415098 [Acipenser ruthenus]|uniref:uncharacterized protein LOC117415098 n=1 Tax=Acipenser ruthenus TaxID=7906 RepID=UPI002741E4A3|nr:uncharacterized protein LOC117415098 [Acipenser ruthenus]
MAMQTDELMNYFYYLIPRWSLTRGLCNISNTSIFMWSSVANECWISKNKYIILYICNFLEHKVVVYIYFSICTNKEIVYHRYLEGLHGAQRISDSKTQDTAESALRTKNKGLQNNFVYKSGGHCTVPSEADKAKCYAVDLISMKCECAVSERGNLCKHIEFAKMMCKEQGIDIDGIRKELASSLTEQHCYEWDGKHLIVHCAGSFGVVHVQNQQCTCLANSLGEICVCLRLSELIGTQNPNQEVTDCFVNTTANCQSHNKQLCVKKMISDLKEWCDSSDYKESPELNAVVKRAHQLAFGQYSMASNKIKIIRLHAYRKRIERARSHAIDMHSYQLKEPLNRALYTHRLDSKFKVCSFRKRIIGSRAKNQILKSS